MARNYGGFWNKVLVLGQDDCWAWSAFVNKDGYGRFRIDGKTVNAHCVAYEIVFGEVPDGMVVDHICRNRSCVNPAHLRPASYSQNRVNSKTRSDNKSGFKGVCLKKSSGKWGAQIMTDGKMAFLGYFSTPEEAHAAYCEAAKKYHGEFANFG